MRKCANIESYIYEEAVRYIWICTRSLLNFLINEENFRYFFNSVWNVDIMIALCITFPWNTTAGVHSIFFLQINFSLIANASTFMYTSQYLCVYIQHRNYDAVKSVVWCVSICMFGVRFHAFWLTHIGMKSMPGGGVGTQRNRGACRRGRLTLHFF